MKATESKIKLEVKDHRNTTKYNVDKAFRCIAPGDVLTCEKTEISTLYNQKYTGKFIALKNRDSGNSYIGRLKEFQNETVIIEFQNEKKRYPDLKMKFDEIDEVYLVKSISLLSAYHLTEYGVFGKENSINHLIKSLIKADEKANKEMINILEKNKRKPIKEIRELIRNVDYTTTEEWGLSIRMGLDSIYYTHPELRWE